MFLIIPFKRCSRPFHRLFLQMTHIFSLILIKYSKHGIFLHFYFRYKFRSSDCHRRKENRIQNAGQSTSPFSLRYCSLNLLMKFFSESNQSYKVQSFHNDTQDYVDDDKNSLQFINFYYKIQCQCLLYAM